MLNVPGSSCGKDNTLLMHFTHRVKVLSTAFRSFLLNTKIPLYSPKQIHTLETVPYNGGHFASDGIMYVTGSKTK
jgi:hypothetical protein